MGSADYGYDRNRPDPDTPPRKWRPVVHGCVEPSTILCPQAYAVGGKHDFVLANFSYAFLGRQHEQGGGVPEYQGPEYPLVSAKTDVWGLGTTVDMLAHGPNRMFPISQEEEAKIRQMRTTDERINEIDAWVRDTKTRNVRQLSGDYSEELDFCMKGCLALEVTDRIDSKELVATLLETKDIWTEKQNEQLGRAEAQQIQEEGLMMAQERKVQKQDARGRQKEREKDLREKKAREQERLRLEEQADDARGVERQRQKEREREARKREREEHKAREQKLQRQEKQAGHAREREVPKQKERERSSRKPARPEQEPEEEAEEEEVEEENDQKHERRSDGPSKGRHETNKRHSGKDLGSTKERKPHRGEFVIVRRTDGSRELCRR